MALQTKTLTKDGAKGHHRFTLTVTENSTSVVNNTSAVAWSLTIAPIVKGYDWVSNAGKVKYSVTVNGKTYSGIIAKYDGSSTVTIKSSTETVAHSADGSKTLSFSFSITDSTGWSFAPGNASASDTLALTRIPRQATITAAPNFTDEQNPTITYSNPAGSAVDSLALCIALDDKLTKSLPYKTITNKTGTSFTYTLSDEDRAYLQNASPNSNTLKVCFCLRTIIGASQVLDPTNAEHFSKVWATMTIETAFPYLSVSVEDTNEKITALTRGGALVRYCSDAKVTTGAKGQKGATIRSQSISCGGVTIEGGTGTFTSVLSGEFHCTATDSRGNTFAHPVTVPFVEYVKLTCSIGNSKPDTDGNFTLTASGVCYNGDISVAGSNNLYVLYRYKVTGGSYSDWMEMAVTRDGNAYTATANLTGLDYKATYVFQCKAGDLVDTVELDEVTIKSEPVFDWSGEDFNFNVPVSAPSLSLGGVQVDYIVEQGTRNGWTYRKWNSGLAECWRRANINTAFSTQWGSLYVSDQLVAPVNYPFTFVSAPVELVTITSPNYAAFIYGQNNSGNTTTKSGGYKLGRGTAVAAAYDYLVNYAVVGSWK